MEQFEASKQDYRYSEEIWVSTMISILRLWSAILRHIQHNSDEGFETIKEQVHTIQIQARVCQSHFREHQAERADIYPQHNCVSGNRTGVHSLVHLFLRLGLSCIGVQLELLHPIVNDLPNQQQVLVELWSDWEHEAASLCNVWAGYSSVNSANFNQNHRKYIQSKNNAQLAGATITIDQAYMCSPFVKNSDFGKTSSWGGTALDPNAVASPCGSIGRSTVT